MCAECHRLLKGYRHTMRYRVRCEQRMHDAMNAGDLSAFHRLSQELSFRSIAERGAKTAVTTHLGSPSHR